MTLSVSIFNLNERGIGLFRYTWVHPCVILVFGGGGWKRKSENIVFNHYLSGLPIQYNTITSIFTREALWFPSFTVATYTINTITRITYKNYANIY